MMARRHGHGGRGRDWRDSDYHEPLSRATQSESDSSAAHWQATAAGGGGGRESLPGSTQTIFVESDHQVLRR